MVKDKYEISLWEDYLVENKYRERKIAVIGSDTHTGDCRAIEPRLVENINGTHTFTFKMFYVYTDDYGKKYQNPFLNLLVNERKVKVLWKDEWYDFIIKNCQENSDDKSITYTCTDLFINELSKTGFDIVLDAELKNNQGTPTELAKIVLEGTDWRVAEEGNDIIQQEKEGPVYEVNLSQAITAHNDTSGTSGVTVPSGALVLFFYDQIEPFLEMQELPSSTQNFQFAYAESYNRDTNSQLVINADCYSFSGTVSRSGSGSSEQLNIKIDNNTVASIFINQKVSDNYRASRLVKSKKSIADSVTGKYCNIYYKEGEQGENRDVYYGYQTVEYNDPTVVNNLLINSKNFVSTEGWSENGGGTIYFELYPVYTGSGTPSNSKSYVRLDSGKTYSNQGPKQSSNFLPDGFIKGQKFIFRYKAKTSSGGHPSETFAVNGITPLIGTIKEENGTTIETDYFSYSSSSVSDNWVEFICTCTKSIKRIDFYQEDFRVYLKVSAIRWLEEIEFFPLYYAESGERMNPGQMDLQSVATTYYVYYNHTQQASVTDIKDIVYSYKDTEPDPTMIPLENDNFEKIRSITIKQSNRFNILQTIADTFECWVKFIIEHDNTGKITYDNNGKPNKYIVFKKNIGTEVGVGFVYGIDLKTIQRTIQSDQIVTKTIVAQNSNEFAPNGFCTIARSQENYPHTNFILNFDYYISHGLIDGGELNKDLYNHVSGIGYYYYLNKFNSEYDALTDKITEKKTELSKQQSFLQIYDGMITSITEQINNIQSEVMQITDTNNWNDAVAYVNTHKTNDTDLVGRVAACNSLQKNLASYEAMKVGISGSISDLEEDIGEWETQQKQKLDNIKAKHLEFYTKYSRYLQEGSWISQDYIDDNLYYLDALSVAYTSSRPQISYNISVLRLSALEEFKNKVFRLGDISFIQDTEFFGYERTTNSSMSVLTPYKEKVLVAEITSYFDEPEKDTFKVQNYKTQFEDLFQRITSTTQSLQYASGEYARAASIVNTNGTIKAESLQASFALNEQLVYSANNESVISDSTGITVSDISNPNKQTKVTSGGVFITTDGGATWKNAIRSDGIATQYLTSGNINTEAINIMSGAHPTFRWDRNGINAYKKEQQQGQESLYFGTSVRYDQFGIYGIKNFVNPTQGASNDASNFIPASEDEIWNSQFTRFGLTWEGFFLKDDQGRFTLKTNANDGTLWLDHALHIGTTTNSGYLASIGYLDGRKGQTAPDSNIHEVVNINEKFKVYEDGSMIATDGTFTGVVNATSGVFNGTVYATDGSFTGEITATSGTIGNVQIGDFVSAAYKVVITSNGGTTFKKQNDSITPSAIVLTATLYKGSQAISSGVTYQWYVNNSQVQGGTGQTLTVNGSTFSGDEVKVYRCDVQYSG